MLIENPRQRLVYGGGDPSISGSADGGHWSRLSPAVGAKDNRRRDRAAVTREGKPGAVGAGIGAVRPELVVVEKAQAGREIEVTAPRA